MKTKHLHLTNREPIELINGNLTAGDILPGVQICPIGDFPNGEDNQHCSFVALNASITSTPTEDNLRYLFTSKEE